MKSFTSLLFLSKLWAKVKKKKMLFSKHEAHAVLYVTEVQGCEQKHHSRDTLNFLGID